MRSSLSLSCIRLFTFVWRLYVRFETFLSSFSLSLFLSFFLSSLCWLCYFSACGREIVVFVCVRRRGDDETSERDDVLAEPSGGL